MIYLYLEDDDPILLTYEISMFKLEPTKSFNS